ncbi:unnamed protein product [Lactuca saligna]|uniref:Uncharacterized protein n=1 Tax=Lactuca saligna TaxID=75948 RepID=A0AA36A0N7_LACSI|nr:unnamed protein product [Lactuca saligna]
MLWGDDFFLSYLSISVGLLYFIYSWCKSVGVKGNNFFTNLFDFEEEVDLQVSLSEEEVDLICRSIGWPLYSSTMENHHKNDLSVCHKGLCVCDDYLICKGE